MEELQDAIEDAQYVNAIATQEEGPRPVLSWEFPDEEQLAEWEEKKKIEGSKSPTRHEVFGIDWCLQSEIGFFLFSDFLKESCGDYLRINFIEAVIQWRRLRGKQRLERAKKIIHKYLEEISVDSETGQPIYPEKKQIVTYDIYRDPQRDFFTDEDLNKLYSENSIYEVKSYVKERYELHDNSIDMATKKIEDFITN